MKKTIRQRVADIENASDMTATQIHSAIGGVSTCSLLTLRSIMDQNNILYKKRSHRKPALEMDLLKVLDVSDLNCRQIHKLIGGDNVNSLENVHSYLSGNNIPYKKRLNIPRGAVETQLAKIYKPEQYTLHEMCKMTGVKYHTLRNYINKHKIPYKINPRDKRKKQIKENIMEKAKWYYCDAIQGVSDSEEEAREELSNHLPWDIEKGMEFEGGESTTYFYPPDTPYETFDTDDGAYTPTVKIIKEHNV